MAAKGKERRLKPEFGKFRDDLKMKKQREINDDEEKVEEDNTEQMGEFTLDEVLRLGGTKADYIMLAGVNEEAELMDGGKKTVIDDLEEGELQDFITKLGISKYSDQQVFQGEEDEEEEEKQNSKDKDKQNETIKEDSSETTTTTTTAAAEEPKSDEKKKKKKKKDGKGGRKSKQKNSSVFELVSRQVLLLKPGGKWYDVEYTAETNDSVQDETLVGQYKDLAQKLLEAETNLYKNKKNLQKGANTSWMKNIVSTGTLADRMAAMTVLIQDAPVHSLEHVENLVALVKKTGGRKQGLVALDTLKELLLSDLLSENRKLCPFSQRPFDELEERCSGNRDVRDRRLVLWYFEHRLKQLVGEFVTALGVLAHDSVMVTKTKTLTVIHELLCNCPEQEKALLSLLVNKLGDPDYKVASKASYLLETLLYRHPVMKTVVCCEVERLMFRPNVGSKAQYYAACFLNQVTLSDDESELASKLITIYFTFFHLCVKKKDVESKMLGALLTGVNRAYPYAKSGDEKVIEQMDTLFKVVHLVKFSTAVQALMLLFQVMNSQQTVSDRYYVALYRKLLDPGLSVNSRQNMFLNLLYKSLKADVVLRRIKAFVKRLLQVSCEQNPAFTCGALFLISEVMKAKPGLRLLLQKDVDGEEEAFQDLKDDEDKDDEEEERFVDADKLEEAGDKTTRTKPAASWVHHQNLQGGKNSEAYDPTHRNPLYCGANHSTLWELRQLSQHYHPSVALFAKTLLQGDGVQYSGDPLQDFTLIRFLHRFVFRNPKKMKGKQNTESTVMQPKHRQSANTLNSLPVNCPEYLSREEHQIPVDEVFFYRFFKKREGEKLKTRRGGDDESVDDVDDEEFEKVLDSFENDSYFTEFKEDELDFAGNVRQKSQKAKAEETSDSDLDSDEDLDDEEVSLGSLTEEDFGDELEEDGGVFMDADADEDDEEAPVIEDEDDAAAGISGIRRKKRKSHDLDFSGSLKFKSTKKPKKRKLDNRAVFAAAEEFGDLLDENSGSKFDNIGMNAMSNRDNASVKQLKWEAKRDDWVQGRDVQTLRRKKSMFKKRRTLGKSSGGRKK